jgi:tetratricopeptide (TPR) repeat protein
VAISYNNIGETHDLKGEYDHALEYLQKALAIKLKQLGANHPSVATSYNNMALVYKAKNDLPKAKEYWEKAHAILLKKLGSDHPNTKLVKGQLDALNK